MEEILKHRIEMEKLVSETSKEFLAISSDEIDSKILETIKKVGLFCNVDRSYIFRFDDEKNEFISCVYEWCTKDIDPTIEEMQHIPVNADPLWVKHMKTLEPIIIPNIDSIPEDSEAMKTLLKKHSVKSALYLPMIYQKKPAGIFGFDSVHEVKNWQDDDLYLLRTIGEIILHVLKRKEIEDEKRRIEVDYHNLFNNMIDAFAYHKIITDEKGNPIDFEYIEVNPSFTRLTGLREENVLGKKGTEILPNFDSELIKIYGECALYGKNNVFEDDLGLENKYFLVNVYSPKEYYFVTSFSDITEKKETEKRLWESEEMYRTFVDQSNDLIFKVGLDGQISYANEYCLNTLGYSKEEVINRKSAFDFLHPDSVEKVKNAWQGMVDEEEVHRIRIQIFTSYGESLDVILKASLLFDENKRPVAFFCIARDIT
jgi:PAS domain S-box-containing protein